MYPANLKKKREIYTNVTSLFLSNVTLDGNNHQTCWIDK